MGMEQKTFTGFFIARNVDCSNKHRTEKTTSAGGSTSTWVWDDLDDLSNLTKRAFLVHPPRRRQKKQ